MSKIPGRLISIGIGKESSRGTAVAPTYWVPWLDQDFDDRVENMVDEAALGVLEGSDGENVVKAWGEGTLKTKIKDKHFGLILLSLLGSVSSAAKGSPNGAVYDHTFTLSQSSSHQSLTVAQKDANRDIAFALGVVDSLKISARPGDYVYYEAKILAKASASASNTVAQVAENDFVAQNLTFKKATAQSGLDAANAIKIRDLTLEFNQNLLAEYVLGAKAPNDYLTQVFKVRGSITLVHDDTTYIDMQNNETYNAMRFDFQNTNVTIGSSANPGLKIDLHRVRVKNHKTVKKLNNIVEETFDIEAHYSLTDSKMLSIILTNLATAY